MNSPDGCSCRKKQAMNCDDCRQLLLMSAEVARPSSEAAGHLAECPDCRAWRHPLTLIEENVRRLPVPASQPGKFLQAMLAEPGRAAEQNHPPAAPVQPPAPLPTAVPVVVLSFATPPPVATATAAPPRWTAKR